MTSEQIQVLCFPEQTNPGMRNRRLRILTGNAKSTNKAPLLKRDRLPFSDEYYYWPAGKRRPDQVVHRIGVNWLYIWFHYWALRLDAKLYFKAEPREYGEKVKPDAFAALEAKVKRYLFFGEFQRNESGNEFDKIPKYIELFERIIQQKAQGIRSYWWVDPFEDQKIPYLTIVTSGSNENIRQRIKKENYLGIPIELMTLDELKARCLQWLTQSRKSSVPVSLGSQ